MLRGLRIALHAMLAGGVALFLVIALKMLAYPHEVIVTEGAIGLAVRSILDGVPLYAPVRWQQPPFVIVHYTPLYYLLTAALMKPLGGLFLAGRLVSVLSTAGIAALGFVFARRETGRTEAGWTAAALWLSFYQVVFWGTTQRVDALGMLLEAAGVLAFASARRSRLPGYSALPAFVLAWTTKQVMIVGMIAAVVDLARRDRRAALRFGFAGLGSIALIGSLLTLRSRGGFLTATLFGTVSYTHADTFWVILSNAELFFGSPWNVVMLAAASGAAWLRRDLFLGLYLWIGIVVAVATDANLPRFFPPLFATAILGSLLLDRLRRRATLAALFLIPIVLALAMHGLYEMRPLLGERVLWLGAGNERLGLAGALSRHTTAEGPVLAQDVGMLLSADRPVTLADPYVFSILAGNGAWRPDLLVEGVESRRYQAIVLNRPAESLDAREWTTLWIAPAREALLRNYRLAEVASVHHEWRFLEPDRYIYVPR